MKVTVSDFADCAVERNCFSVTAKNNKKMEWIDTHNPMVDENGRVFINVVASKKGVLTECIMDAVTGSLYKDGVCLSNPFMRLGKLKQDKAAATKFLMSLKYCYD